MPVISKNPYMIPMSCYHLRDPKLSFAAKGLLTIMLADDGTWNAAEIESKQEFRETLPELIKAGYVEETLARGSNGEDDVEYTVYQKPNKG